LLVDAAHSANAAFALRLSDYPLLAEIARRVDGLPLALELAGANIPLLGVRGVLDRLGHAFSVLGSGPPDLAERLRTMRNAIAWSYDLLSKDEQSFFRRLSVFTGGFTLEMAEAMVRGWQPSDGHPFFFGLPLPGNWIAVGREEPDLSRGDWTPSPLAPLSLNAISGLDSLVQQNLVRAVHSEQGVDRFQLLETIREFGLEQLDREGERDAAEHARALLLMAIAELSAMAFVRDSWRLAAAWIEAELPNIRAALAWLATQPPSANQIGLRMVETLWIFWQSRGYVREGCAHLEACLARPGGRPAMRAQALNLLAALSWIRNDLVRAISALDEALAILDRIGFLAGQGRNFMIRALIAWSEGDYERMEKMTVISRDRMVRGDDHLFLSICPLLMGISARGKGDRTRAIASFNEAYQEWMGSWNGAFVWGMAIAQYFLGEMAREDGDRVTAVGNIRDALDVFVDLEDPWTVGGCVGTLATYLYADGELEEAARLLGAAHQLESSHGLFLPPTEIATHEAAARDLRERIGPDAFADLFVEGERFSMQEAAARAMTVTMESPTDRAARMDGRQPHPLLENLTKPQLRTLQLLDDGLNVKQIALVEGRADSSIYERIERIKEVLGLPPETTLLALLRFVDSNRLH
jgi:non-specific serine/threonine protein kinase